MERVNRIPCSVGVLTYNSAETLERCLVSLKDFAEIIVADGGSTDETLTIARKHGCTIIEQSNPGNPITDFSLERNRMLDAATRDWFFYLDSDEVLSAELSAEIASALRDTAREYVGYRIPYRLVSPDLTRWYRTLKPYFQVRLFKKSAGARFYKKAHEKVRFTVSNPSLGTLNNPWLVPLDVQLDFAVYKEKISRRLPQMIQWKSRNPLRFVVKGLFPVMLNVIKHIGRVVLLRLRYSSQELVPLRYELYRLYSYLWTIALLVRAYVKAL